MKQKLIFILICFSFNSYGQSETPKTTIPLSIKYAGTYSYGKDVEKGKIGSVAIYPETDSTILFSIDLNRGAPSYNMGFTFGRVKIKNDVGIFYNKIDNADKRCKLSFQFINNDLKISTVDNHDECGFGHAVYADGTYQRTSNKVPESFTDSEGKIRNFKDIKLVGSYIRAIEANKVYYINSCRTDSLLFYSDTLELFKYHRENKNCNVVSTSYLDFEDPKVYFNYNLRRDTIEVYDETYQDTVLKILTSSKSIDFDFILEDNIITFVTTDERKRKYKFSIMETQDKIRLVKE